MDKMTLKGTREKVLLMMGLVMCGLPFCHTSSTALPPAVAAAKSANTPVDPALIAADNDFGFELFGKLAKRDPTSNLFISPSSVALALNMVYNGARGETKQGIARALGLGPMNTEALNTGNAALIASLSNPDPKVELSIANSLWIHPGTAVNPAFIKVNQDVYGAEVAPLTSIGIVNEWVNKQTHERIKSILEPGDERGRVILINAIYFKGLWSHPFKTEDTKQAQFTLLEGRSKNVKMMHQAGTFFYFKGESFQAVRLPYGRERLQMVVMLPDKGSNYQDILRNLNAPNWVLWGSRFGRRPGDISLPAFRVEYEAELLPMLKTMGINGSDFSGIAPRLAIDKVRHKTFLEVSEEGTEAAAVTSVHMKALAIPRQPAERFTMVVDHPFICAIIDSKTGAILFLGSITEPM